ncbi:hypothetical protein GCM10010394_70570 [Streptomyces crystallinus]|uniref:Uncharacterized protein n=1 Tax=Streptomyces crystallinus TaxID=68191 RepID=A0ABN1H4Y0_9ACTN
MLLRVASRVDSADVVGMQPLHEAPDGAGRVGGHRYARGLGQPLGYVLVQVVGDERAHQCAPRPVRQQIQGMSVWTGQHGVGDRVKAGERRPVLERCPDAVHSHVLGLPAAVMLDLGAPRARETTGQGWRELGKERKGNW